MLSITVGAHHMAERMRSPIPEPFRLGAARISGCLAEPPLLPCSRSADHADRRGLFTAVGLMLIVVIPVFVMAFVFAWFYRPVSKPDVTRSGLDLLRLDGLPWSGWSRRRS